MQHKSNLKKILLNGGIYSTTRIFEKASGFVLIPLYAAYLGADGYGIISLLSVIGSFYAVLVTQGLNGAWVRLRFEEANPQGIKKLESSIIGYLSITTVISLFLFSTFGETLFIDITNGLEYSPLGLLTLTGVSATIFIELLKRKYQIEEKPLHFSVITFSYTIIVLLVTIYFVAYLKRGALGKIEAACLISIVFSLISLLILKPKSPFLLSKKRIMNSLVYGLPLVPHAIAGLTNDVADRLIITHFLGFASTGIYSMGYQIAFVGTVIASSLNQALSPIFIKTMKQIESSEATDTQNIENLKNEVTKNGLVLIVISGISCLIITAYARNLLELLTNNQFSDSWRIVPIVSAGIIATSVYFAFSQSIFYHKKSIRLLPILTIFTVLVNITGNYILVPIYGIVGAAWSTVISNSFLTLIAMVIAQKNLPLPYNFKQLFWVLIFLYLGLISLWFVDDYIPELIIGISIKTLIVFIFVGLTIMFSGLRAEIKQKLAFKK